MPKHRKKPVVIEAEIWTGDNYQEMLEWSKARWYKKGRILVIDTPEGRMEAHPGDYIIRGIQGEFYPCKPDIFNETYEPVEDTHGYARQEITETDSPNQITFPNPTTDPKPQFDPEKAHQELFDELNE